MLLPRPSNKAAGWHLLLPALVLLRQHDEVSLRQHARLQRQAARQRHERGVWAATICVQQVLIDYSPLLCPLCFALSLPPRVEHRAATRGQSDQSGVLGRHTQSTMLATIGTCCRASKSSKSSGLRSGGSCFERS